MNSEIMFQKKEFNKVYVYVTTPVCKLKYIIEISDIINYPQRVENEGDGNDLFNEGKKAKFAYKINKVYKLNNPIKLSTLKTDFKFTPPQSYAYEDRYKDLSEFIEKGEKELLWKK